MNKEIFRLSVPNIVSNITVPLLGMVDLAMMGHLDNPVYIGAIALGGIIFNVIYHSFAFLRMGSSGFTAQAYGAKNNKDISLVLIRSLLVAGGLALILLLLQYPIQWVAFHLLDGSEEVKNLAREYFYIRIYAAPATLGLYALYGWFLGLQNARIPMVLALTVNLVNILFNFIFIYALGMKSDGVAWASVLAQYTGLLLAVIFLLTRYKKYVVRFSTAVIFQLDEIKRFFRVNSDIFIRTLLLILVLAFFISSSAKISDDTLAVNSLLFQFFFIFSYFADGFAFAGEALAGKARGAGDPLRLRLTVKHLFRWGWGASVVFGLLFVAGLKPLLWIMTDNRSLIAMAYEYRFWIILLPLTSGAAFIWDGIYIGVTASKAMRNTMIVASLLVFLPAYYLTIDSLGNHGLWFALNLFMISRGLLMWKLAEKAVYIK
ncbi:MAG: MATE family efflux transporter [Bacteroidetes bacterium]|nr:MAG: MATE family efflux transporter [Bacteroidota bacterium]RLD72344.1 MAG: MATE family efflux transporter [Bacteroidota bacterium]RLD88595.1 MAG: MATE family efflux transporter [Bacteroidota bacterium]